jgi:hypothetical protein
VAELIRADDRDDEPELATALWRLEERFWGAGAEVYRDAFAPDGLVVVPDMLLTQAALVEMMETSVSWGRVTVEEAHVVELSDDVTALSYRASATREDLDAPFEVLVTSVYRHADGPTLVLHQQSPILGDGS